MSNAPSTTDAIAALQSIYGLSGTAKALVGEIDANFHIICDNHQEFILKLHYPNSEPNNELENLKFQNDALNHLANSNMRSLVPQLIPTTDGNHMGEYRSSNGAIYISRLLTWMDGIIWSDMAKKTSDNRNTAYNLGNYLARLDLAFVGLETNNKDRHFLWDARYAGDLITHVKDIEDCEIQNIAGDILQNFKNNIAGELAKTPMQIIHNDANDNNILLTPNNEICGIIDFGDIIHAHRVQELGVAGCYLMFNCNKPMDQLISFIQGYHNKNPLLESEIALIFQLILIRLAQSITQAARQIKHDPDNQYLLISQNDASALLKTLWQFNPHIVHFQIRDTLGFEPVAGAKKLRNWLRNNSNKFTEICNYPMKSSKKTFFDLSAGSDDILAFEKAGDTKGQSDYIFSRMADEKSLIGIGHYMEDRIVYDTDAFAIENSTERRTMHMGVDLFLKPEEPIYAPYDGKIIAVRNRNFKGDYGAVILMQHEIDDGQKFWTLYGHLSQATLNHVKDGDQIAAGDTLAWVGDHPDNGDWPPHLHFQIYSHLLDMGASIDGVAPLSLLSIWQDISPDPNLILGAPEGMRASIQRDKEYLIAERKKHLSRTMSLAYNDPLKIVKGRGAYLYDEKGNKWLDMVNNVCHVGHCHPRVVKAGQQQMAQLNTNSRYLHDNLVEYVNRLLDTFPDELNTCFLVNSGSEANDLAMRLAKLHTGGDGVVVLDNAYHGHLSSMIDISPYKFNGKGGQGKPDHVAIAKMPDGFRGEFKYDDKDYGIKYADDIKRCLDDLKKSGHKPAVFYAESLLGVGGQHCLPENYLKYAYQYMREEGALCLADEVQVGFGRVGSDMWAFKLQNVVPDIVTLGKPIANGHPMAAVITKRGIAESFVTGMEYFNTFAASPVSSAIGLAVLDVISDERLSHNAVKQGKKLIDGLKILQESYPLIGDIRGVGLFIGAELVKDLTTLEPDAKKAKSIVEHLKTQNILLSLDGPDNNVLKMKPPICICDNDIEYFLKSLTKAFGDIYGKT